MGSTASRIGFDQRKRSPKSKLPSNHNNKLVIFGENTVNQVAFLPDPISSTGQESYSSKFKVTFGEQADPVIGVAAKELDPLSFHVENNPELYVWFVARGSVEYCGAEKQLQMPLVESGDELMLNYVVSTGTLSIRVIKPGQDSLQKETKLDLPSGRSFLPFVAASTTGSSRVEFLALESTTIIHTNNSLNDVTHKVIFTTTYGIVDLSRDFKSALRTATQQGNGCALLPIKISSGVHHWAFSIRSDFGASMCLGLARYPFMLSDEYVKDHLKHVYRHPGLLLYRSYRGLLYRDGKQLTESLGALGWQHNSPVTLEFIYDGTRGTLEIIRNNERLGVAFDNLVGSFQPVVCFYAAYEKEVKLKHYLTTEPLNIVQSPQSAPEASPTTSTSTTSNASTTSTEGVCFDTSQLHGNSQISKDRKSIFRDKSQSGNSFCFLNVTCHKNGTYRFSFIVEYDQGASACIGVTSATSASDVRLNDIGNVYTSGDLYMYRSFQGMLYNRGREQGRMAEFWMSGTLVEMEVKITDEGGAVTFKVNAESQREGFSDLKPPLTPVIGFYAGMEKRVTILHYECEPSEPAVLSPKLLPRSSPKSDIPPLQSTDSDSGLNDLDTVATHAQDLMLPILCSSKEAAIYYPSCMTCDGPNDTIALPCRHSSLCSKDLSLGINAPTRHCMICDAKVVQVWNILTNR